jgi:hypothetical protein
MTTLPSHSALTSVAETAFLHNLRISHEEVIITGEGLFCGFLNDVLFITDAI